MLYVKCKLLNTSRIAQLRPVAVDVSLSGGYGRVANFDTIMSVEHARWRHLRSRRAFDWDKVWSALIRFASLPRANKRQKQHL